MNFVGESPETSNTIYVRSGDIIGFNVFFVDLDSEVLDQNSPPTCSGSTTNPVDAELPNKKYSVKFMVNDVSLASFNSINGSDINMIPAKSVGITSENLFSGGSYLYIKNGFTNNSSPIQVTCEVTDNTALPNDHISGSSQGAKDDVINIMWTLEYDVDGNCATSMKQKDPTANNTPNNQWITISVPQGSASVTHPFKYEILPDLSPNYNDNVVTEFFGAINAGPDLSEGANAKPFFGINDVARSVKKRIDPKSADSAAQFIFGPTIGEPSSFSITTNGNSFTDRHALLPSNSNPLKNIILKGFKSKARTDTANVQMRFQISQSYKFCGQDINNGEVTLSKRLTFDSIDSNGKNNFKSSLKKNHSF